MYLREKVNLKDKRHLLTLLSTLIIFLSIPLTVALVQQSREPTSRAATTPNDQLLRAGFQWPLAKIRGPDAWDITTGSSTVVVALVDTGVHADHPDLVGQIVPGFNAVNPGADTQDDSVLSGGHGTKVAGVIGAATNNAIGIAGVSWQISMMPVKVCDPVDCSLQNTVEGIRWATQGGADIINVITGYSEPSAELESAISYALGAGRLVVAGAGNTRTTLLSPAD